SYFIMAAASAPANDNDGELLLPLLDQERKHFNLVPPELTVDKAADLDPLREQIAARGILAHIPVAPAPNSHGVTLFDADDFAFNPQDNSLTCPAGHTVKNARPDTFGTRDGAKFTFSRPLCRACPLLARCQPMNERQPTRPTGRSVHISAHWR